MYKIKSNAEIGEYLDTLIKDRGYKSTRQFGIACLRLTGNAEPDEETVRKMSNRLSQIKKGNKGIQLTDLPVFTELLQTTAEDILSCGSFRLPKEDRYTNYTFAASHDRQVWEDYIGREDKILLFPDEFHKTVLDYAMEFKNYDLLKYMMDEGYIWFVGKDDSQTHWEPTFGAGSKIKRPDFPPQDVFNTQLMFEDRLRMDMILMALEHGDFPMLERLRANEVPSLYLSGYSTSEITDTYDKYHPELVEAIAAGDEKTVDFFSRPFQTDIVGGRKATFLFPYMNELLDRLLQNKSPYALSALRQCEAHNRAVFEELQLMCQEGTKDNMELFGMKEAEAKETAVSSVRERLRFDETHHILDVFLCRDRTKPHLHIHTNIVHYPGEGHSAEEKRLIQELNTLYDRICSVRV